MIDLLLIGVVAKAHGLRGELVVVPFHADSPLWTRGTSLYLLPPGKVAPHTRDRVSVEAPDELRVVVIERARKNPDGRYTVGLAGAFDRDAAEALRGYHLGLDAARLPPPAEDELYHHELPGWHVVDVAGTAIGTVVGMFDGPGGELLEVDCGKKDTVFVPFVDAIVKTIDRSAKRIVIDPPDGLLDLDAVEP
ncbi:MAG: ribosome maturation factor RimM [Myxococcota bacterium]